MLPVHVLGKSLEELREHLDLPAGGQRFDIGDDTVLWSFRSSGVAALLSKGLVNTLFLYSDGYEGFAGYTGETGGLRLDSSKQVVRFKFGFPTTLREGETSEVLGTVPNFDRYDYDDYSLHIQYDETGTRMTMLSIMSPNEVKRFDGAFAARPGDPVVYDKAKYHFDSVQELGLPDEQAYVHTAFFLGWLMENDLCSKEFVDDSCEQIEAYKRRETTALDVYAAWDGCLVDDMLSETGNAFAASYFDFSNGKYIDDFAELLVRKMKSEFHVPYTWENQAKINHRIGKRYRDWQMPMRSRPPASKREKRANKANQQRPTKQRREEKVATATSPPEQAASRKRAQAQPSTQRPAQRSPGQKSLGSRLWQSARVQWILKFIVFPILAVAIGLAIVAYAMTL
ncbi:MAG: hypothetical protein QNJ05_04010 [Woeseiaceae bacterium]|nr:hypothetical protein [Woeseiaceae bacterium]